MRYALEWGSYPTSTPLRDLGSNFLRSLSGTWAYAVAPKTRRKDTSGTVRLNERHGVPSGAPEAYVRLRSKLAVLTASPHQRGGSPLS